MTANLRVLMISHGYFPRIGGAERQLGAIAPFLQKQGIDVHIATRRLPATKQFEIIDGIPVHRLPIPGPKAIASLSFTLAAMPLIRQLNPSLVHAHELISPSTTAVAAKMIFGKPILATLHGSGASSEIGRLKLRPSGRLRLQILYRAIDAFIVISKKIDQELASEGVPVQKRIAIPNGVDVNRFVPVPTEGQREIRSRLGLPVETKIITYVGRLAEEKGIETLANAWQSTHNALTNARLLILGSGPLGGKFIEHAGADVLLLGEQNDVVSYLQASDLFVLPSLAEGLSVALLEALACGLPIIATAVGGTPEIITHGSNGWLIQPNSPAELRDAFLTVLNDPGLMKKLGENGHRHVVQNYSLEKVAEQLASFYRHLCDERRA